MLENINGDEVLRYHADVFGLPEEMLRSKKEVEQSNGPLELITEEEETKDTPVKKIEEKEERWFELSAKIE